MKKFIINEATINGLLNEYRCRIGSSLQTLCVSILDHEARTEGGGERAILMQTTVRIEIALDLLPESYVLVPPLFGRTLPRQHLRCYPALHSFLEGDWLTLHAGKFRAPTTFKSRVQRALQKYGKFSIGVKEAPMSYRKRSALLANVLTKEMNVVVCNDCKDGILSFYVVGEVTG